MTLEIALQQNTAAILALTDLLSRGVTAVPPPAPGVEHDEPAKAEEPAAARPDPMDVPAHMKRSKKDALKAEAKTAEPAPKLEEAQPQPTYAQAADAVNRVAAKKGRAAALGIITRFGATATLKEVAPENFVALIAACGEELAS